VFTEAKQFFRKSIEPAALLFARLGFTPNGLTLLGLFLGLLSCALYVWNRNTVLFGCLMIFWGLFDVIDGALARVTNRATKFGSYLDAVCDRVFESFALLAVGWVSGYWKMCFLLMIGGLLISYAKARAAMEVQISNDEWPDFMERAERDVIFVFGLLVWGLFPLLKVFGKDVLFWTLLGLSIAVYGSFFQRVLRARRLIQSRG